MISPNGRMIAKMLTHYLKSPFLNPELTLINGVPLPAIAIYHPANGRLSVARTFGYKDYGSWLS